VRAWLAQAREAALREQLAAAALEKKQIKAEARSTIAGFREREARVARFQRLAARAARRALPAAGGAGGPPRAAAAGAPPGAPGAPAPERVGDTVSDRHAQLAHRFAPHGKL